MKLLPCLAVVLVAAVCDASRARGPVQKPAAAPALAVTRLHHGRPSRARSTVHLASDAIVRKARNGAKRKIKREGTGTYAAANRKEVAERSHQPGAHNGGHGVLRVFEGLPHKKTASLLQVPKTTAAGAEKALPKRPGLKVHSPSASRKASAAPAKKEIPAQPTSPLKSAAATTQKKTQAKPANPLKSAARVTQQKTQAAAAQEKRAHLTKPHKSVASVTEKNHGAAVAAVNSRPGPKRTWKTPSPHKSHSKHRIGFKVHTTAPPLTTPAAPGTTLKTTTEAPLPMAASKEAPQPESKVNEKPRAAKKISRTQHQGRFHHSHHAKAKL